MNEDQQSHHNSNIVTISSINIYSLFFEKLNNCILSMTYLIAYIYFCIDSKSASHIAFVPLSISLVSVCVCKYTFKFNPHVLPNRFVNKVRHDVMGGDQYLNLACCSELRAITGRFVACCTFICHVFVACLHRVEAPTEVLYGSSPPNGNGIFNPNCLYDTP